MPPRPEPTVTPAPAPPSSTSARALLVINDLRMGGAERSMVSLVNHLGRVHAGIVLIEPAADLLDELVREVAIFSLESDDGRPLSTRALEGARAAAIRPRGAQPPGRMLLELPTLLRKAHRLVRLARATGSPVVSTFLNRAHTIALLAKLLFAPRLRVVINVHEMLSDHLERFFSPVERRVMRAFISQGFPRADRIIAVSEAAKEDLVRHFSVPADRIAIVPNPIDGGRVRRAAAEAIDGDLRQNGAPLIVAVGRLVKLKGFDILIRAVAALRSPLEPRLVIVGNGEERVALQALANELGIASRVAFVGTQLNPWKFMARADVVALPSRIEAAPNVIGEALALAVPVIATRCSDGVVEYLDGGRSGLLVPPDDVTAFAEGLERLLRDDDLRRRLAHAGAQRAAAFDIESVVERYESVIADAARP
ncbi:MAG: glycosyltransferase [Gemmatimonadaceae bacterium]